MNPSTFQPSDFESPDIRRLCDIVMKGGITSGAVYPLTICKLATAYAIKNIGGTSVGAIAAAITAAAEYRRRQFGSGEGYAELAKLPQFLGRPGALLALFAADAIARVPLKLALILIGTAPMFVRLLRLAAALMTRYVWIPLLASAIVFAVFYWVGRPLHDGVLWRCCVASLFIGTVFGLFGVGIRFVCHIVAVLKHNKFGWCHGYRAKADSTLSSVGDVTELDAKDVPPIFNWLEAFIAQTSGKPRTQPLTFGDLWSAPQPPWHNAQSGERCIDFRMVTTCLTLGRPFQIPFDPNEPIGQCLDPDTDFDNDNERRPSIYFCVDDLEEYFSAAVVKHMTDFGAPTKLGNDRKTVYYRFPAADKVPIIVATRMSMSFPVLFCAFPLYALDATGVMQQLWFSDGGLTSNFPIHFFDSPLPRWPTFAIDLLPGEPPSEKGDATGERASSARSQILARYVPGAVFMENEVPPGTVNPWNKLSCDGVRGNVMAFASAILDAARNWQDVTLGTLPGNAGRIVGIRLSADQGGLNLNMPPQTIDAMTQLGLQAGGTLVDVFATGQPEAPGWKSHRWLRFRAIMGALTRWAAGYQTGYRPFGELPAQQSYPSLILQELPDAKASGVLAATDQLASLPIKERFYQIEEPPIAVLPTRPVV